mmetsp:Transcript_17672/g.26186  ORF Transcript_17672/g.26186 Transcript_17672/m.26186 type:complete len:294 (-) Transcript_17672:62-943(-)
MKILSKKMQMKYEETINELASNKQSPVLKLPDFSNEQKVDFENALHHSIEAECLLKASSTISLSPRFEMDEVLGRIIACRDELFMPENYDDICCDEKGAEIVSDDSIAGSNSNFNSSIHHVKQATLFSSQKTFSHNYADDQYGNCENVLLENRENISLGSGNETEQIESKLRKTLRDLDIATDTIGTLQDERISLQRDIEELASKNAQLFQANQKYEIGGTSLNEKSEDSNHTNDNNLLHQRKNAADNKTITTGVSPIWRSLFIDSISCSIVFCTLAIIYEVTIDDGKLGNCA